MSTDSSHMDFLLSASRHHHHQQQQYDGHHHQQQHHNNHHNLQQQQQQPQVYYNIGTSRPTPTACSPAMSDGGASTGGDCVGAATAAAGGVVPISNSSSMSAAAAAALLLQVAVSTSSINGNAAAAASPPNAGCLRRCSTTSSSGSLFERPEQLSPSFPSASALTAAAQLAAAQQAGTTTAISPNTTSDLQAAVLSLALAVQTPATTASTNNSAGSSDDPRQAVNDFLLLSKRHPGLITSSLASVFRRRSSAALLSYPTTDGTGLTESSSAGELTDTTSSPSTFLPPNLASALGVLTPQLTGNSCGMQNVSHPPTEADWDARGFSTLAAAAAASVSPPDIADVTKMPNAKPKLSPNVYAYDGHYQLHRQQLQHQQQQLNFEDHHHLHGVSGPTKSPRLPQRDNSRPVPQQQLQQHRYPVQHQRGGSSGLAATYFKHSHPTAQEQALHVHLSSSFNSYSTTSASGGRASTAAPYCLRPHGMSSLSPLPTGMLQSPPPPAAVAAPSLGQEASLSPPTLPPPPPACASLMGNEFGGNEFAYGSATSSSIGLPSGAAHPDRLMEAGGCGSAAMHEEQITPTSTGTATPDYSVISGGGGCGGGGANSGTPATGHPDDPNRKREQRLMKNREAARECRRKKKEYVKCLEARVSLLESQNQQLIEELNKVKALCLSELYCGLGLTGPTAACAAAAMLAAAGAVTAVPGTNYSSAPPAISGAKPSGFQSPQDLKPPVSLGGASSTSSGGVSGGSNQIGALAHSDTASPLRGHRSGGAAVPVMHRRRLSLLSSTVTRHRNENGAGGELGIPSSVPQQTDGIDLLSGQYGPTPESICQPLHLQMDEENPSAMPVKKQRGSPVDVGNNSYLMPTSSNAPSKSPVAENSDDMMYHRRVRTSSVGHNRARGSNPFRSAFGGRRQQLSNSQQHQQSRGQHLATPTFPQTQLGSSAVKRGYPDLKSSETTDALVAATSKSGRFGASTRTSSRGREHDDPSHYSPYSSSSSTSPSSCPATAS